MLLGWLVAFYDIPEGVVAPLSRSLGGGDLAAGLILAAAALGASLGAVGFSRLVSPERRLRWMTRIAPLAPGVLVLFAFRPALRPLWPSSRSRYLRLLSGRRQRHVRAGHPPVPAKPGVRNRPGRNEPGTRYGHDQAGREPFCGRPGQDHGRALPRLIPPWAIPNAWLRWAGEWPARTWRWRRADSSRRFR